jgi:hypothetical protein
MRLGYTLFKCRIFSCQLENVRSSVLFSVQKVLLYTACSTRPVRLLWIILLCMEISWDVWSSTKIRAEVGKVHPMGQIQNIKALTGQASQAAKGQWTAG